MSESMDDTEMREADRVGKEAERRSKKEMSVEELLTCPTRDCDGGPDVWRTGVKVGGDMEIWKVGCPKCKGWTSQMVLSEDDDAYMAGIAVWMAWRKDLGH